MWQVDTFGGMCGIWPGLCASDKWQRHFVGEFIDAGAHISLYVWGGLTQLMEVLYHLRFGQNTLRALLSDEIEIFR